MCWKWLSQPCLAGMVVSQCGLPMQGILSRPSWRWRKQRPIATEIIIWPGTPAAPMDTLHRFTGSRSGEGGRENIMDVQAMTDMLETYVRPATFPVGIKMLKPGEAFPPRTRTPADLGSHFATCQTINVVRRYGWSLGLAADHHSCPLGLVALGFKPNVAYLLVRLSSPETQNCRLSKFNGGNRLRCFQW